MYWNSNTQCDGIWRWGLWEVKRWTKWFSIALELLYSVIRQEIKNWGKGRAVQAQDMGYATAQLGSVAPLFSGSLRTLDTLYRVHQLMLTIWLMIIACFVMPEVLGLITGGLEPAQLRSATWAVHIHVTPNKNPGPQGSDELSWFATVCMCGH